MRIYDCKQSLIFLIFCIFFCAICQVTFAANSKPLIGVISPSNGSSNVNEVAYFTTTFTDANGWQNVQYVNLLINTSTLYTKCFYGYYNQNTNKLYLRNDANTAWLGGFVPGSPNIIENSYARLDCSKTIITGSGVTLNVKWAVVFKSTFYGAKKSYLYVKDDSNAYSGLTQRGTWVINRLPAVGTITPASGSIATNQQVVFTAVFNDPDGYSNLKLCSLLINSSTNLAQCFYGYYDQNANKFYLANDTGTAFLGGFTPGSANVIENSYAKLDCSKSTITNSGNNITVKWAVTFKNAFNGSNNVYLYAKDDYNAYINWTKKGDYCIYGAPINP